MELPYVEQVADGKAYKYTSSRCDALIEQFLVFPTDSKSLVSGCKKYGMETSYGTGGITYSFFPTIETRPQSVNYTYTQAVLYDRAYLSSGQCVRSD